METEFMRWMEEEQKSQDKKLSDQKDYLEMQMQNFEKESNDQLLKYEAEMNEIMQNQVNRQMASYS